MTGHPIACICVECEDARLAAGRPLYTSRMLKNVVIAALLAIILFLCAGIVRIENQRYALFLGMCKSPLDDARPAFQCLETVQTRTSPLWHLYYALLD